MPGGALDREECWLRGLDLFWGGSEHTWVVELSPPSLGARREEEEEEEEHPRPAPRGSSAVDTSLVSQIYTLIFLH